MQSVLKLVACVLAATAALHAFERTLDVQTLDQAVRIGQSRFDAERTALHRPYRLDVGRAPVDWIDIVTPFRRVVLEAELHTRNGGRLFGQREALAILGPMPERVDVVVDLTFHPLNTFIGVPSYDVVLEGAVAPSGTGTPAVRAGVVRPGHLDRVPRFGARVSGNNLPYPYQGNTGLARGSEPLTGGVIVAQFDGGELDAAGVYYVVISDGANELARARVDLGRLR
jgi:hypothetical protein